MPWVERLASGRYRAAYRDRSGKVRSGGTYARKKDAESAAAVAEDKARSLGWRDPAAAQKTWGEWCTAWWDTRAVEPGTLSRDASRRDARLLPRWGDVPLIDITRHDVKAWAAQLRRDGLSAGTVQRHVHLFSASLTAAIDAEVLTTNPAWRISIAKGDNTAHRYLDHRESAALLDVMPSAFDLALVSTFIGTGLRWGEALGLQVGRVNFERGIITVAEVWDENSRALKAYPKGRKRRDVPMPLWVSSRLSTLIADRTHGFVFESRGSVPGHSNWRTRVWLPALHASGIGHLRVHDLRHTYASWLIQNGVALAEVGRLLGHVSPLTTQLYAHLADTPRDHILAALPDPARGADVEQLAARRDRPPLRLVANNPRK